MEPFYADPKSQLKPLAAALVEAAIEHGDTFYVLAFNQATPENESPQLVYPNTLNLSAHEAIRRIELASKNRVGALADTDFQEAIGQTLHRYFSGQPGIAWIITNNRNSPNNDPYTARRNQEFYELLHNEPSIARILVYPLAMPVSGKIYPHAQGLMVYALAYGKAAEARLLELVQSPRLTGVLPDLPARLKPLDRESVRLVPKEIADSLNVEIRLAQDQKTTILEVDASDRQPVVTIRAELENLFYPYRIDSARVSARFLRESAEYALPVSPENLDGLAPGARREVSVSFLIPYAEIPSVWSWSQLRRLGTQLILPGRIQIDLSGQQLTLDQAFIEKLAANFPNDPISSIFTPPRESRTSSVTIPVSIRVNYPVYPIVVLIVSFFLLLALLLLGLHSAGRARQVTVSVDGLSRKLLLKPRQTLALRTESGEIVGEIKGGWFGPRVVRVADGHRIHFNP